MPIYLYSNPKTGKILEVVQGINDSHEYIDAKGLRWNREFTVPNASIDTEIDPFSPKEYIEKMGKSKTTFGELLEKSKELSDKRVQKMGHDPIKADFVKKEKRRRHGKFKEE